MQFGLHLHLQMYQGYPSIVPNTYTFRKTLYISNFFDKAKLGVRYQLKILCAKKQAATGPLKIWKNAREKNKSYLFYFTSFDENMI